VLGDEALELGDEVAMAPEPEVGVDAILERSQSKLLETRALGRCERLVGEVGERSTAPDLQALPEHPRGGRLASARERLSPLAPEPLEPVHVELAVGDADQVAGAAAQDRLGPEQLPQPRHEHLEVVRGARRRLLAPDLLDERVGRDDLVRPDQERREQRALLAAAQR